MKLRELLSIIEDTMEIEMSELYEIHECGELKEREDLLEKRVRITGADYARIEITFED